MAIAMGSHAANRWLVSKEEVDLSRPQARAPHKVRIAAEPQNVAIDAGRTALIVVDMQNDFCAKGGYLDYRGVDYTPDRKPIEPLRKLIPQVRRHAIPI